MRKRSAEASKPGEMVHSDKGSDPGTMGKDTLDEPLLREDNSLATTTRPRDQMERSLLMRILTAVFYGAASFLIMVVNKQVLTVYKFPSFQVLGLGQMAATIVVLLVGKWTRVISFPGLSLDTWKKIWPLPVLYLANMLFGLGGTQELSLPMLTVLRRFSILMTMIGEFYILKVVADMKVQMSVYMMIFGAIIAALNDLAFNLKGYIFVLLNDLATAVNGVVTKKKLDSKDLGKYGILFYNSLFMFPPTLLLTIWTGELSESIDYPGWYATNATTNTTPAVFIAQFLLSCFFGFILMYSTVLCTQYNSALTTTIVGCLKNILITYLGMIIGGDYLFSWLNFIGLTISVVGSLFYAKITFTSKAKKKPGSPLPTTQNEARN